jgi:hypothetical protein
MSQPPDNFEHGLVHDEGEAEDYTPEVPQDANGDPVWDPPTFPAWDPEPNCPVLTGAPQMGQISSQPGAGYNQDLQNQMASRGQFDPNNEPLDRLDEARKVAAAAFQVCNNPKNYYGKEGKFYLKFEGWQAIAAFSGCSLGAPVVKDNMYGGVAGITAKAFLMNSKGKVIGEGEGFVGSDETFWKTWSDRINGAQTRAVDRVCRMNYAYIVQIMNQNHGTKFESVPYEELVAYQALERQATQPPPPQPPALGQRQPNVQPSVGQQSAVWQGQLMNVEIKMFQGKNGPSELFIIHLTDRRNASTFDKTIAGSAGFMIGKNVEMQVVPRGQGRYNVSTISAL